MGGLPLACSRKGADSTVAPPADTSQHCSDPEGNLGSGLAGPREIQSLRKVGTDKGAYVSAWLRKGRKLSWTTPEVRFWTAMGEVGEVPGRGAMDKQKKGQPVTSVVRQEPGKGLEAACGFDFMINVHILELWVVILRTFIKQRLSTSKTKRQHSISGTWAWVATQCQRLDGYGVLIVWPWVTMVGQFSSPGFQGAPPG